MWEKILDRLFEIGDQCADENWDFNGEESVSPAVILNTIKVIRKLDIELTPTCIKPMWDGRLNISFKDKDATFSILISQFHTQCVMVKNPGNVFDQKFLEMDSECLEKLRNFIRT